MLDNPIDRRQRWQAVDRLLASWLEERQQVLVQFCAISRLRPLSVTADHHREAFGQFCETLVDYVSAGHFEIYEQLLAEATAFGDTDADLSRRLYKVITKTTRVVLDFNDHCMEQQEKTPLLARHLSQLGTALEVRFDAEDQLIDSLHQSHAHHVA